MCLLHPLPIDPHVCPSIPIRSHVSPSPYPHSIPCVFYPLPPFDPMCAPRPHLIPCVSFTLSMIPCVPPRHHSTPCVSFALPTHWIPCVPPRHHWIHVSPSPYLPIGSQVCPLDTIGYTCLLHPTPIGSHVCPSTHLIPCVSFTLPLIPCVPP